MSDHIDFKEEPALVPGVGRAIDLLVQNKTAGLRLDQFLVLHCPDFSRSILQKAIEDADSIDAAKLVAALDKMKLMTFYGVVQFSTEAKTHGKQVAHDMVYMQWQKDSSGKLVTNIVWPEAAKSADATLRK